MDGAPKLRASQRHTGPRQRCYTASRLRTLTAARNFTWVLYSGYGSCLQTHLRRCAGVCDPQMATSHIPCAVMVGRAGYCVDLVTVAVAASGAGVGVGSGRRGCTVSGGTKTGSLVLLQLPGVLVVLGRQRRHHCWCHPLGILMINNIFAEVATTSLEVYAQGPWGKAAIRSVSLSAGKMARSHPPPPR